MNYDLNDLTALETNSRRAEQNFDLRHTSEDNKFQVSESFFTVNNMDDNGITAHYNQRTKQVFVSIQPNNESVSFRGRDGMQKGKAFTSKVMSELFTRLGFTGDLQLVEAGQKNGATFFAVELTTQESTTENAGDIELAVETEETV